MGDSSLESQVELTDNKSPITTSITNMPLNPEKLKALQAKAQQTTKVGGMRRKKKVVQKQGGGVSDDKRIQQTLKKFACSNLPGIDEVNMFKEDGTVIHFKNPKVTASPTSNTFVVAGHNDVKKITEIPGVLNQLGLEGLQGLQQWAKAQGLGGEMPEAGKKEENSAGLEDIPETGNFDEAEEDAVE